MLEAQDKLGGTANLAAIPPNKGMITEFVETMKAQLEEAGVEVRLGAKADLAAIKATGAEAVFMAAGGSPVLPSIPGIEGAVTAEEILGRETPPAEQNIVIIGGGVTGLETAEYLSEKNKVTVVEMLENLFLGPSEHKSFSIASVIGASHMRVPSNVVT